MKHALAALVALSASACLTADESEPELGVIETHAIDPGSSGCQSWGCGANSATVGDGLIFDEVDRTGVEPNRGGLRLVSATAPDGSPAILYVYRQWLMVGAYGASGWHWYTGRDVINTTFVLNHRDNGNYTVKVTGYNDKDVKFWAGLADAVPAYELMTSHKDPQHWEYACGDPLADDPGWTGAPHYAVLFQGDRYDAVTKKARDVGDSDPWFNIACKATAPAKMLLMRHARASSVDSLGQTYASTDGDRTAMLKMFTADYCGNGHTFTVDGTPLAYQDAAHWKATMETSWAVESYWTATGATCLHEPRFTDRDIIESVCPGVLHDCQPFVWPFTWENSAHVFSALR